MTDGIDRPREALDGAHASDFALLRSTTRGRALVAAWWLLLAGALAGALALVPYVDRGRGAVGDVYMSSDALLACGVVAALVVAQCVRIGRGRAMLGLLGLAFGVVLLLFAVRPALAAGAPVYLTTVVATLLMMFVTLRLTHGRRIEAVAGAVGMAASLGVAAALAAWLMPIAAPDNRQLAAAAVMAAFGALCDVTVTQVSSVIATARRAAGERFDAAAQRRTVRDSLFIGGSHLTSMVHTLSFAFFSHAALVTTMAATNVGADVAIALVAAWAMAIATELVTRLAVTAIGGVAGSALAQLDVEDH